MKYCTLPIDWKERLYRIRYCTSRVAETRNLMERTKWILQQQAELDSILAEQGFDISAQKHVENVHSIVVPFPVSQSSLGITDALCLTSGGGVQCEYLCILSSREPNSYFTIDPALNHARMTIIKVPEGEDEEDGCQLAYLLAQRLACGLTISVARTLSASFDPHCITALEENFYIALAIGETGVRVWRTWVYQRLGISLSGSDQESLDLFAAEIVSQLPVLRISTTGEQSPEYPWSEKRTSKTSIIIPVWNQLAYTLQCLDSLNAEIRQHNVEVIVIDNGSNDGTAEALLTRTDVKVITNETNKGFTEACNQGAQVASGDYLLFLNNDTIVLPGCLEHLLACLENDPGVWAAGSRLIYPNGRLQEAAALIFNDGTACNFGRHDHPALPIHNTPCSVDYCSGASLMVRTRVFRKLGGFDMRYSPAYYEETDLCFAIREQGGEVVYEPASAVIHFGSTTAGLKPDEGARRYLFVNREKFVRKWARVLVEQESPPKEGQIVISNSREMLGRRVAPVGKRTGTKV